MAKAAGRKQLLKKAGTTIAGIRVTGLSADYTPIDITSKDDAGIQLIFADYALAVLSLTVSGVESDHVLRDIALNPATSQLLTDVSFVFADALAAVDTITGNFFMSNFKEDADYKDAVMFSATFTSSGSWTRS